MTHDSSSMLPEGFRDTLPPVAKQQAGVTRAMLDILAGFGYERVSPPLAEFEDTFTKRVADGGRNGLLRVTDPVSGRALALRGDITMQLGRLASSRLAQEPRPLRLSYSGQVLRLHANQLRPERELSQLGAELIGNDNVAAVSEIVSVAVDALIAAGLTGITVDFTLPDLVETLAQDAFPLDGVSIDDLRNELDMKDAGAIKAMGAPAYLPLLEATGAFETAIAKLREFDSTGVLKSRLSALEEIAERIDGRAQITLDPTERHGFEYQSWFGFTLFAEGYPVALGRGGTYYIDHKNGEAEEATGFSLYPDPIVAGMDEEENRRIFLPMGTMDSKAAQLRAEGWVAIAALGEKDNATDLGCTHILSNGRAEPL